MSQIGRIMLAGMLVWMYSALGDFSWFGILGIALLGAIFVTYGGDND